MDQNLSKEAVKNVNTWLSDLRYAEYQPEIEALVAKEDWQTLEDSFYKHIEFGTAGMRGTTGPGPAKINRITIGEAAAAVATYLKSTAAAPSVAIAYDTRNTSVELSRVVASILATAGIKVYYFESYRSTPELSFAIRHLKTSAGIVISASHNPPADNGFKIYWSDGAQVSTPDDKGLLAAFASVTSIKTGDFDALVASSSIKLIGEAVDTAYLSAIIATNLAYTSFDRSLASSIKIAYSPLHGAGQTSALPALRGLGFNVATVDAQMSPDGDFPALPGHLANPEIDSANDAAIALMQDTSADLAVTTDPDADRLRLTVATASTPEVLNGNQSAALAADYLLRKDPSGYICKTIVTTDLLDAIAEKHGTKVYGNFLIGFKYIGRQIRELEPTGARFIIGAEESYGMLVGPDVRDKDAATGAMVLAEAAAELKSADKTLYDRLEELYQEYGIFIEEQLSAVYPGAEGFKTMQNVMKSLRATPLTSVGDRPITKFIDCLAPDTPTATQGDVIILEFDSDPRHRITIRPSGTEPKLKFYGQWHATPTTGSNDLRTEYTSLRSTVKSLLEQLKSGLL